MQFSRYLASLPIILPSILCSLLWQGYETVETYDPSLPAGVERKQEKPREERGKKKTVVKKISTQGQLLKERRREMRASEGEEGGKAKGGVAFGSSAAHTIINHVVPNKLIVNKTYLKYSHLFLS